MSNTNDIAVIGMSCRFPDARNPEEYWDNLWRGRVSVREIPASRWNWRTSLESSQDGVGYESSRWGAFLEHVDSFDRAFFGISAREAESMDPQQRLSLELAWTCFESAGIRPAKLSRQPVGVFVGAANLDYKEIVEAGQESIDAHYASGIGASVIANRLSYYFDFVGPSVAIDTACSSSLFAVHAACQSLRGGECSLALAGGVSLLLTPKRFVCFSKAGMLSPTGAVRSFDDAADGMVRGEGGGLVLLKRMADAEAEGDMILGVIKGSAVNHNGRTYSLTYPNAQTQAAVIKAARKAGDVEAADVTYLEAHGTGTPKGDPIELEGIKLANGHGTIGRYCGLGSAKANIGHLEAAAGIAGIIKVLLALRHRALPPLAGFTSINSRIDLVDSGLAIIEEGQSWPSAANGAPLTAGISSFGFAGTNAHVVLQAAPEHTRGGGGVAPAHILCLAAKTTEALIRKQREMLDWLRANHERWTASEVCATLLHGREHFSARCAVIGSTLEELISHLQDSLNGGVNSSVFAGHLSPGEKEDNVGEMPGDHGMREIWRMDPASAVEHLKILAGRYVRGEHPDQWRGYPSGDRIASSLPTYPFEKTRCWVGDGDIQPLVGRAPDATPTMASVEKPNNIVLTPLTAFATSIDHLRQGTTDEDVSKSEVQLTVSGIDALLDQIYAGDVEVEAAVEALSGYVVGSV